jgi:hypothetical protein
MKSLFKIILVAALAAGYQALVPAGASAEQQAVLTISPLKHEFEDVKRRSAIKAKVTLRNSGSSPVRIVGGAEDFIVDRDGATPLFVRAEQSSWSMSRWMKINPARFTLAPGEVKTAVVTITVPPDGEPGGHYAAAMFATVPPTGAQTGVKSKLGSLFLVNVRGKIREEGRLDGFIAPLVAEGPVSFKVSFANSGNVHLKPIGKVWIGRPWGGTRLSLPLGSENVFPKSSREFTAVWRKPPVFGVYLAQAEVTYGSGMNKAITARRLLVVMPWRLALGGAALLLFGAGIGFLFRRRAVAHGSKEEPAPQD